MNILLSRDDFREGVFARDNHKCVICGENAADAHHILERRLFPDGGYYLDNGASLCSKHHIQAETTELGCAEIRQACGIMNVVMPPHLYTEAEYDKWGNEYLSNGMRIPGELFNDISVQKILKQGNVLQEFTTRIKYPRTYHLPWSEGMNRDDRMMDDVSVLHGKEIVITEKMDGENTTWYSDYTHARSVESASHPSRNWMKNLWAQKGYNIPQGWRVCGENMFAKHAIHYSKENDNQLSTYFYMFSIWDELNFCLSWKETEEWAELLELELVPVLYKGHWDDDVIKDLTKDVQSRRDSIEGYVIRPTDRFHYSSFRRYCGKYVRSNHVNNNHGHWTQNKIIKNELEG